MAAIRFIQRNGIALLALFIALGGTTYAATGFPANSIGAKQLKKGAVTRVKIKNNAVTGAKVAKNSITGADVLESSLGQVPSAAHSADSDKLGGLAPSSYQQRVTGTCGLSKAISSIAPNGSVTCATQVFKISIDAVDGAVNDPPSPLPFLAMGINCGSGGATIISFVNTGPSAATLNWIFGGTSVTTGGVALGTTSPGKEKDFSFSGSYIEGQFVFANGSGVTTVNLHVQDKGAAGCEARGTAEVSS